ncbi:hypothetical protein NRI_0557 [Neorickettsia risticii str. Illinois]|uniref:Uncharacterized protein n=1 Tax=Neorickettsia risticii (strain Illinois) TaxID=434131 RepID=C6V569_NEORI|nr:hypothetical protein NRI_0557 [Neorickettsia risticii str. Illinois]
MGISRVYLYGGFGMSFVILLGRVVCCIVRLSAGLLSLSFANRGRSGFGVLALKRGLQSCAGVWNLWS